MNLNGISSGHLGALYTSHYVPSFILNVYSVVHEKKHFGLKIFPWNMDRIENKPVAENRQRPDNLIT